MKRITKAAAKTIFEPFFNFIFEFPVIAFLGFVTLPILGLIFFFAYPWHHADLIIQQPQKISDFFDGDQSNPQQLQAHVVKIADGIIYLRDNKGHYNTCTPEKPLTQDWQKKFIAQYTFKNGQSVQVAGIIDDDWKNTDGIGNCTIHKIQDTHNEKIVPYVYDVISLSSYADLKEQLSVEPERNGYPIEFIGQDVAKALEGKSIGISGYKVRCLNKNPLPSGLGSSPYILIGSIAQEDSRWGIDLEDCYSSSKFIQTDVSPNNSGEEFFNHLSAKSLRASHL